MSLKNPTTFSKLVVLELGTNQTQDSFVIQQESLDDLRKNLSPTRSIVKLHAAPIQHYDILKLLGQFPFFKAPLTLGSEGSGIIVESQNKELIGKKVSFTSLAGTYREYQLVSEDNLIVLQDDTDLDSAACGFINPLTTSGLIDKAIKLGAKGVINLAATSAIGRMVNNLALYKGLSCLNVIRGDAARVESIKKLYNNEYVISLDQGDFVAKLKEISQKLQTTVCFDPIGGNVSGLVFNNLPQESTLLIYGVLDSKIQGIDGMDLITSNKRIEGIGYLPYFQKLSKEEQANQKLLISHNFKTIFDTSIEAAFSFAEIQKGLELFPKLKGGKKIIIKPTI